MSAMISETKKTSRRHKHAMRSLVLSALLVIGSRAIAGPIAIGDLAFNTLIPSATASPGINVFVIDDFTGNSSLPPTFPVSTPLTFLNSSLTLNLQSGVQQVITSGDLSPGSYTPVSTEFPTTTSFLSATLTANLSSTTITLSDGSVVSLATPAVTAQLVPSSGSSLQADTDFVQLVVLGSPVITPEPSYTALVVILIATFRLKSIIAEAHPRSRAYKPPHNENFF